MHTPVRNLLAEKRRGVETIGADRTVSDAVQQMNENRIGSVLVTTGGEPVGIFTERDVLVRVIAERKNPDQVSLREVMTKEIVSVPPDTTVADALVLMSHHRCRHLPVIENNSVVGMISIGDLTNWLVRRQEHRIDDLHRYISGGYPTAEQAVP